MHKQIEGFRLSAQQTSLWLSQRDGHCHLAQCALLLDGPLEFDTLRRALQKVVARHDILSTTFHSSPGARIPIQIIAKQGALLWLNTDISDFETAEQSAHIEALLLQDRGRSLNLERGPLMRLQLVMLAPDRHILLVSLSTLCADSWSLRNLVCEITRTYDDLIKDGAAAGGETDEEEVRTQYLQFSEWQNQLLNAVDAVNGRAYWERIRAAVDKEFHLPCEVKLDGVPRAQPNSLKLTLRPELVALITEVARKYDVSSEIVLLAGWLTLLWRLTGKPDVVVSRLFNGRKYEELHDALGAFAQFLPVRCQLDETLAFKEFLWNLNAGIREASSWQEYFAKPETAQSDTSRGSCAIGFEFEELPAPIYGGGLLFSVYDWRVCLEQFRLKLSCVAAPDSLRTEFHYDPHSFSSEHIRLLAAQFHTMLESGVRNPEASVAELEVLGDDERRRLLVDLNETQRAYPREKTLHQWFEEQAARTPERVALVFGERQFRYQELNERANRLGHYLRRQGVGPEVIVGICAERSLEMVVALLGVLKAGGAYLPLDPTHPTERLAFMVKDAGLSVVLTQRRLVERVPGHAAQVFCLDTEWPNLAQESNENPAPAARSENLAYVIYTSGSTGRPKGVMIPHRGLVNYLSWCSEAYRVGEGLGAPLHSSLGFDLTVTSLFPPLLSGASVYLVDEARGLEGLSEILRTQPDFSLVKLTPAHLEVLSQLLPTEKSSEQTRALVIGGDALWANSLSFWRRHAPATRLINEYGPTETVVGCCVYEVEVDRIFAGAVPIGRPIANTQLYILNSGLRPVPAGVTGELYIGGDGVGRGYLNRPATTAESFIPNPFSRQPGARLYRTGDLARHLPEGQIEYVGRIDRQFKVRGYRIEPGEIEAVLSQHPEVREAAVLGQVSEHGEKQLVAYVVPQQKPAPAISELRLFLQGKLPEYMVPSSFFLLDRMPLTANGKVDLRALPPPDTLRTDLPEIFDRPRTTAEHVLAAIWSEVLGLKQIGVHDNFFALGGDSIRSVRMLALAKERGFKFTLQDTFKYQTIYSLAREVKRDDKTSDGLRTEPFSLVSETDLPKLPEGLEDAYPLSQMQLGMLYHMELIPEAPSYHNVSSYHIRATFDVQCLQQAAKRVLNRHPVLRTSFDLTTYSEPLQLVHPTCDLTIPILDLCQLSPGQQEIELAAFVESEWRRLFDLSKPPLVRFHVHRRSDDSFQFTVTECHAIVDGWSITSIFAELFNTHFALIENKELPFKPPPTVTFRDYVAHERQALASLASRQYWKEKLEDCTALKLPRWSSPARKSGEARIRKVPVPISRAMAEDLKQLANKLAVPLKSVMLAVHLKVLSVVTGEHDILTGLAGNGRPEELDAEEVRGLYVLTSPLRVTLNDGTWADLIRDTFKAEWELLPHRLYPMAALQKSMGMHSLLETEFHYLHFHSVAELLHSGKLEILDNLDRSETNFTLMVGCQMNPVTSGLTLDLHCDMAELSDKQADALAGYYERILSALLAAPQRKHNSVSLLDPDERHQLQVEWNDTDQGPQEEPCLHQLFERQVERAPQATAVSFGTGQLSFEELNARANQLAWRLRKLGVGPEVRVGLCMERAPEMIVGILGVLKAGGVCVPLDPAHPQDRLALIMQQTEAQVLLSQGQLVEDLPQHGAHVICLDSESDRLTRYDRTNPLQMASAANLAYIIFTSGSTGLPKGVCVSHAAAASHMVSIQRCFGLSAQDRVLQFASLSLDVALEQILAPLICGATLVLRPSEVWTSHELLTRIIEHQLTVVNLPPAYWNQLTQELVSVDSLVAEQVRGAAAVLRLMVVGGDVMPTEGVTRWRQSPCSQVRLLNAYGPTETTITSTTYEVREGADWDGRSCVPIGKAVKGRQLYVLDRWGHEVAIGGRGELHIGGEQVARCYLNRADWTAERFVPDPYSGKVGGRMYRTGDVVRWNPAGYLEYEGRSDSQVKVRGFRIELGEVESGLSQLSGVKECAVAVKEDAKQEKRLVAYVVAEAGKDLSSSVLRRQLGERLPAQMIPTVFVQVEAIPLGVSGKVDRRALPLPDGSRAISEKYVAPRNDVEAALCDLWMQILGVAVVGVHDHFLDLGGDSLLATQLISKVRNAFQVEIPLSDLLVASTVAEFARKVQTASRAEQDQLRKISRRDTNEFPLSFAQERLWMFDQIIPDRWAYNIPIRVRLRGSLRVDALEAAIAQVTKRHQSLRTRFLVKENRVVQIIDEPGPIEMEVHNLRAMAEQEREIEALHLCEKEGRRSFDLSRGGLLRAGLIQLTEDDHIVLLTTHHIVSDDWSMAVLIDELAHSYEAFCKGKPASLPELNFQYGDYAVWQREWTQGEACNSQIAYWKSQLANSPKALRLRTDRPRPAVQTFRGASRRIELNPGLSTALKTLSREQEATLFMTLLAAFNVLLKHYSDQEDILVGTPIANRTQPETEGLLGCLINTLVLRTVLAGDPTFRELLRRVRQTTLQAYANQDLPFEKLLEELKPDRDTSRPPLFQVMFSMHNVRLPSLSLPGLSLEPLESDQTIAKYDLLLNMRETDQGLIGVMEYNSDLFDSHNIACMLWHFELLLGDIAAKSDAKLSELVRTLVLDDSSRQTIREANLEEARAQKYQKVRRRVLAKV